MPAQHIDADKFESEVIKADKPTLVDFYADWCGPCKAAAPVLDELADEADGNYNIIKINVDENQEISQEYGVMSIPTVILFNKGEEVDRQIGFAGKQGYQDLLGKAA